MSFFRNFKSWLKWLFRGNLTSEQLVNDLRQKGVSIGENVNFRFPSHTVIDVTRPTLVEMGDNLDINDWFTILTHDFSTYVFRNKYNDFVPCSGRVKIGSNIYFGRNVTILKGVTIGDNCIIGLGSVVTRDIPPNSVACGSPCRVICTLEEYYKRRKYECVKEALQYAASIIEKENRDIQISDFHEEWALFVQENEYNSNPIVKKNMDFRLNNRVHDFLKIEKRFNGFAEFKEEVNLYISRKKK